MVGEIEVGVIPMTEPARSPGARLWSRPTGQARTPGTAAG